MMIYTLNIISQWLLMIGAVIATTLLGYAINRARQHKAMAHAQKISLKKQPE